MKLKTKIGIISLGIIVLVIIAVGIYWVVGKKTTLSVMVGDKTIFTKETKKDLPKKLEPKLVWQKEFDSEILDFVIPRMPEIRKPDEFPIVAIDTEKELLFFDKKGNIAGRIPIEGRRITLPSENGEYLFMSVIKEREYVEFPWDVNSWKYLVYTGEELWRINDVYGWPIDISPEGDVIIVCKPDNGIWFYDKNGKVIKSYNDIRYECGSALSSFSADGKYYVFSFVFHKSDEECEYGLILFEKNGKILWKQNFNDSINELHISHHGEVIFIECGLKDKYKSPYFYLFDKKGTLLWQRSYDCPQDIILSPKGDILVIENKGFSFSLIDTLSSKEFNLLEFRGANSVCVTSISPDSTFLSIVKKKVDGIYKMYIISKEGEIIFKKNYNEDAGDVTIEFSSDNSCFIIVKEIKRILVYKLTF